MDTIASGGGGSEWLAGVQGTPGYGGGGPGAAGCFRWGKCWAGGGRRGGVCARGSEAEVEEGGGRSRGGGEFVVADGSERERAVGKKGRCGWGGGLWGRGRVGGGCGRGELGREAKRGGDGGPRGCRYIALCGCRHRPLPRPPTWGMGVPSAGLPLPPGLATAPARPPSSPPPPSPPMHEAHLPHAGPVNATAPRPTPTCPQTTVTQGGRTGARTGGGAVRVSLQKYSQPPALPPPTRPKTSERTPTGGPPPPTSVSAVTREAPLPAPSHTG